ncbi:MAG TPA: Asp-tRNA(Asn)/Glu-tRNA(Gln) amidotransferase subunit GatC [Microbacteriaceae bacterium]|nr:Asp-tRNA(Asn)/Glu-tRNA(Gln) amidotransferase subunit GatC [Microbacteriaceae bacterium]
MTDITAEQVEHLASLARIALTPDEITHFAAELTDIMHAVEQVNEVAGDDVPPTSHPIPLANVSRADEVANVLDREEALKGAPEHDGSRFVVTAILGEEQ